jgi:hypothetical protein
MQDHAKRKHSSAHALPSAAALSVARATPPVCAAAPLDGADASELAVLADDGDAAALELPGAAAGDAPGGDAVLAAAAEAGSPQYAGLNGCACTGVAYQQ